MDQASVDEEVRIAGGTYSDVHTYQGLKQIVYIDKSLTVHGGFSTTNWANPSATLNPTTLDAGGLGRVVVITGTVSVTLERLRITGGDATGMGGGLISWDAGGGLYVRDADGTIRDCEVFSNTAGSGDSRGGGFSLFASPINLRNNVIYSNTATHFGGGIDSAMGTGRIEQNTIISNTAYSGAGASIERSANILVRNTMRGNTASLQGGAIKLLDSDDVELESNTLIANSAYSVGGGISLERSDAWLTGNFIIGNQVTDVAGWGGGIALLASDANLINNIVAGNQCNGLGAGIYVADGRPDLFYTTIAGNMGGDGSGVYVTTSGAVSTAYLINSIITGHAFGVTAAQDSAISLEGTLWHSNGADRRGAGAITHSSDFTGDPLFVDPTAGDYHIRPGSAAIDRGVATTETEDIDGDSRPLGAGHDLGADELGPTASYVVSSARDDDKAFDVNPGDKNCEDALGACTLRAAIQEVNAGSTSTLHGITFSGPMTITLDAQLGGLPYLERPVVIDAHSAWDMANGRPGVALLGDSTESGLVLTADGCNVYGMYISGFWAAVQVQSAENSIGGPRGGQRNVLSGNHTGVEITGATGHHNIIQGNTIGLSPAGDVAEPNEYGIAINNGAADNLIGGGEALKGNIISGNSFQGLRIEGEGTDRNRVGGNLIGGSAVDPAGPGNADVGIRIAYGPAETRIGGGDLAPNVIRGNGDSGIHISEAGSGTRIEANAIRANAGDGIRIYRTAGCTVLWNWISENEAAGVRVTGAVATGNRLSQNAIWANGFGIGLGDGANAGIQPPAILGGDSAAVSGTACAGCMVEIFSDAGGQGRDWEGDTTADSSGNWTFSGGVRGPNVTAVNIDSAGNTSEFSLPWAPGSSNAWLPLIHKN